MAFEGWNFEIPINTYPSMVAKDRRGHHRVVSKHSFSTEPKFKHLEEHLDEKQK
jgi:hypothetical protein